MSSKESKGPASLAAALRWPLIAYGALASYYYSTMYGYTWFSWHPFCMILSFVVLAANAALIKKIGGYDNTKLHGTLMFLALLVALFGWYVIYTNKEMQHKQHLTTYHGKLGFGILLANIGIGLGGMIGLNPDFGIMKTNKALRFFHKWGGRVVVSMAWADCVLGVAKLEKGFNPGSFSQILFILPLLVFGFYVLL